MAGQGGAGDLVIQYRTLLVSNEVYHFGLRQHANGLMFLRVYGPGWMPGPSNAGASRMEINTTECLELLQCQVNLWLDTHQTPGMRTRQRDVAPGALGSRSPGILTSE